MISAPASGQGKTTLTAALARRAQQQGLRVRVFKTGPDFLDPMLLEAASGAPVHQLDLWMCGEAQCRQLLAEAAREAELILVEGVMGLYDGEPSSADLAQCFGLPVLALIEAGAMAQTFAALAHGLRSFRSGLRFHGVFANGVGSAAHAQLLQDALPADLPLCGWLAHEAELSLPQRHLGLVQARELPDLDRRLDALARALQALPAFDTLPLLDFTAPAPLPQGATLENLRIGIARDEAFAFVYPANLDLLRAMGARLSEFSPLHDAGLPQVDALYLPGGYPELHAARLARNTALLAALREHHARGKPLLAECGGMMLLCEQLVDADHAPHTMAGLLPARALMQPRLQALSLQSLALPDGELRGHSFHYSTLQTRQPAARQARTAQDQPGEAVFQTRGLTASYLHFYLPSCPPAAASLFSPCAAAH